MTEPQPVYTTATAVQHIEAPSTLIVSRDVAHFVHEVQRLRNEARRGHVSRVAVINLDSLEIGSIIAFEV